MGDWVDSFGLAALFLIVALQAAGVPGPPGKTALVIAALLAADGRLVLWQVLVVAALAITAGGMIGYAIGHRGGRPLLERWWPRSKLDRLLSAAERFFERHGGKSVFVARLLPGFKVAIAPVAGIARMRLRQFLLCISSARSRSLLHSACLATSPARRRSTSSNDSVPTPRSRLQHSRSPLH